MRFSESWLREWVNPDIDTRTLVDQLSMAGLEVDAVDPAAPHFSGVVVGRVLSVQSHPDAGKLRVCRVDLGADEPVPIVCGAANVAADMRVAVATVGAELPGGIAIKQAKLRGVKSFGMICSASELGLAESSDGIMSLPADAPPGADVRAYLELDDICIELDLTPDRSDCLSIAGIAREVGVLNRSPLAAPPVEPVRPTHDDRFPVRLEAPAACPRYVCRIIRSIDAGITTPLWMRERLRRSGMRSINPVVDVTNYVLLELGQPMHGFDLARLNKEIRVRMAHPGERIALLGGEEIDVRDDTLVIADAGKAVALAGIMGGAETGVDLDTRDILLESAFFAPQAISGKARRYGLHTDSSHRFERGVDSELQTRAMERATRLLLDIVGGDPGPIVAVSDTKYLPRPAMLTLRRDRIRKVLGVELSDDTTADILSRLGMHLAPRPGGWEVSAPTNRFDILLEVDLIADIGRIYGYGKIPVTHASSAATAKAPAEATYSLKRAKLALVGRGYQEAITYSFVSPELQSQIAPERPVLTLTNPLSADMSVMRTSLWPGLLTAARQNRARQQERVRIFESGLCFLQEDAKLIQEPMLSGLVVGTTDPEQWHQASRPVDFYDLKADVQALLHLTGQADCFRFVPAEHSALHPGQAARIDLKGGRRIGMMGMLHPALASELDIDGNAFLFELELAQLEQGKLPKFSPLSKFPTIRRDLAILVDADVPYERIRECVVAADSDLLRDLVLFDVYQGEKIDSERKSVALGLILQASSQTLTDQDVERSISSVLQRLETELGARLRD